MREIRSNGEIRIGSIDAKITQTTKPQYDQDNRIMVHVILKYLPIALFLSNNQPEMYCSLFTLTSQGSSCGQAMFIQTQ